MATKFTPGPWKMAIKTHYASLDGRITLDVLTGSFARLRVVWIWLGRSESAIVQLCAPVFPNEIDYVLAQYVVPAAQVKRAGCVREWALTNGFDVTQIIL
jgi:hypothetical protein